MTAIPVFDDGGSEAGITNPNAPPAIPATPGIIVRPDSGTDIGSFHYYQDPYGTLYVSKSAYSFSVSGSDTFVPEISVNHLDRESVRKAVLFRDITSIGDGMFYMFPNLYEVDIPQSVRDIGSHAFYGCESLRYIDIPGSVTVIQDYAFYGCESLVAASMSDSVTYIGPCAFQGCTSLTGMISPSRLTSIEDSVFQGCTSLSFVWIPPTVTSIGEHAFHGCESLVEAEIPNNVRHIGDGAFYGCTSLLGVEIPHGTTYLGDYMFYRCTSMEYAFVPSTVVSIGMLTFGECTSLAAVSFPSSLVSIGSYAFTDCRSLRTVTLPASVTGIDQYAFYGCDSLETVYNLSQLDIAQGSTSHGYIAYNALEVYGEGSIAKVTGNDADYIICRRIHSYVVLNIEPRSFNVTLPQTFVFKGTEVTNYSIGTSVGADCAGLVYLTIPASVSTVEEYAFANCENLTTVTVLGGPYIGDRAFYGCTFLRSVDLGSVTALGKELFTGCEVMKSLRIPSSLVSFKGSFDGLDIRDPDTNRQLTSPALPGYTYIGDGYGTLYRQNPDPMVTFVFPNYIVAYTAKYGSVIELPDAVPVKKPVDGTEYRFVGWAGYREGMTVTEDVLFTAMFEEADEYTVTFVFPNIDMSYTAGYGDLIEIPDIVPVTEPVGGKKYRFVEWAGYLEGMTVTGDVSFTAVFEEVDEYTVTFVFPNISLSYTAEYGDLIEVPDAVPVMGPVGGTNYEFVGWKGYREGMVVTGDVRFTAIYERQLGMPVIGNMGGQVTVCISYNDGTVDYQDLTKGGIISESRFVYGYYRDPGFTEVWIPTTKVYEDLMVYAMATLSGSAGGDTMWKLDFSTGTLEFSGTGPTDDWNAKTTPWYAYRGYITSVDVKEGVTYLGSYACYKYPYLTDIVLSDSLVGTGKYSLVTSVAEHVKVGTGLVSLGMRGLFGMTFYEGQKEIGAKDSNLRSKEFYGTDGTLYLERIDGVANEVSWTIDYDTRTLKIHGHGSAGDWTVKTTPWYGFKDYFDIISVENGVTEIGDYSFYGYSLIESIFLADSVERIGVNSLRGCSSLMDITFGKGLTTIGSNALTGYTFITHDGKTLKNTPANLAGYTFMSIGYQHFVRHN
ncbi:MAG: leucine-rich repeat domain-containing protein [archaeon]|nr:leucine-rich repeat domain-containing protein [archaeon]